VLGVQVAVAVADPVVRHALLEQRPLPLEEAVDPAPQEFVSLAGDRQADVAGRLLEVLVVVVPDRLDPAHLVDPAARLGPPVEIGHLRRDGVHGLRRDLALGQEPLQHPVLGEPSHHDGVLHGPPDPEGGGPPGVFPDGGHLQVGLRRQPPVEPQLLLAESLSFFERREVEEPEVDGLLHLVDPVARDEDEGDVRLHEFHRRGTVRVETRSGHGLDELGVGHGEGFPT